MRSSEKAMAKLQRTSQELYLAHLNAVQGATRLTEKRRDKLRAQVIEAAKDLAEACHGTPLTPDELFPE